LFGEVDEDFVAVPFSLNGLALFLFQFAFRLFQFAFRLFQLALRLFLVLSFVWVLLVKRNAKWSPRSSAAGASQRLHRYSNQVLHPLSALNDAAAWASAEGLPLLDVPTVAMQNQRSDRLDYVNSAWICWNLLVFDESRVGASDWSMDAAGWEHGNGFGNPFVCVMRGGEHEDILLIRSETHFEVRKPKVIR